MEELEYIKISIVINRFGIDEKNTTKTFAMMGPRYFREKYDFPNHEPRDFFIITYYAMELFETRSSA